MTDHDTLLRKLAAEQDAKIRKLWPDHIIRENNKLIDQMILRRLTGQRETQR
jgi:hypothetical protein